MRPVEGAVGRGGPGGSFSAAMGAVHGAVEAIAATEDDTALRREHVEEIHHRKAAQAA